MTTRKQLLLEIRKLEKDLIRRRQQGQQQQENVSTFLHENKALIAAVVIPVLIAILHRSKNKNWKFIGKQAVRVVTLAAAAGLKKQLWQALSRSLFKAS
jgi:hypothetical protein